MPLLNSRSFASKIAQCSPTSQFAARCISKASRAACCEAFAYARFRSTCRASRSRYIIAQILVESQEYGFAEMYLWSESRRDFHRTKTSIPKRHFVSPLQYLALPEGRVPLPHLCLPQVEFRAVAKLCFERLSR